MVDRQTYLQDQVMKQISVRLFSRTFGNLAFRKNASSSSSRNSYKIVSILLRGFKKDSQIAVSIQAGIIYAKPIQKTWNRVCAVLN